MLGKDSLHCVQRAVKCGSRLQGSTSERVCWGMSRAAGVFLRRYRHVPTAHAHLAVAGQPTSSTHPEVKGGAPCASTATVCGVGRSGPGLQADACQAL